MLKIFLARHGQDEDNARGLLNGRRDEPLTDLGIIQANKLAQEIKDIGLKFDVIYSSPLQRAFETSADRGLDPESDRGSGQTTGFLMQCARLDSVTALNSAVAESRPRPRLATSFANSASLRLSRLSTASQCARLDSNQEPPRYKLGALTN